MAARTKLELVVKDPVIYLDVDGVLIVPDKSSECSNSVSAKTVRSVVEVGKHQIPTAKDSWKNVRLKYADEAKRCLAYLADSKCRLVFLTTHPHWSVALLLNRMGLYCDYEMAEEDFPQSFLEHEHHKASVVETSSRWAWMEDGLDERAEKFLESENLLHRYVEVDPLVGITMRLTLEAMRIALH